MPSKADLPANIADIIQRRLLQEFDVGTAQNYQQGGAYTKPDSPPGEYSKGTYTKHDYWKETPDSASAPRVNDPRDLLVNPVARVDPSIRDAVRSPEFQTRLKSIIDTELKKLDGG